MDRVAWLNAQPWMVSWKGCGEEAAGVFGTNNDDNNSNNSTTTEGGHQCKACGEGRFGSCELVAWSFSGYASFHVNANTAGSDNNNDQEPEDVQKEEEEEEEEDKAEDEVGVPPNASHLFFAVQPPYKDPAQLGLKVGIFECQDAAALQTGVAQRNVQRVVLVFDDMAAFVVDSRQVLQLPIWHRGHGDCLWNKKAFQLEQQELHHSKSCVCQKMPDHILLKFRHVGLIMYNPSNRDFNKLASNESAVLFELLEKLNKVLANNNLHIAIKKGPETKIVLPCMDDISKDVNKFLSDCQWSSDSLCIAAAQAVEVCSADYEWMSDLLNTMAQGAARDKGYSRRCLNLHQVLQDHMQVLKEEEQVLVQIIWDSDVLDWEERQEHLVTSLHVLQQKIEQHKENLLILDLILLHWL